MFRYMLENCDRRGFGRLSRRRKRPWFAEGLVDCVGEDAAKVGGYSGETIDPCGEGVVDAEKACKMLGKCITIT